MSKIAVPKYGVLRAVRFASGKSTESSKQNSEAGGIAKKQTRQSDAKEAAERLAEHIRSADAAGLSYGMYMAKKSKTTGIR